MKLKISFFILAVASLLGGTACHDSASYADLLRDEKKATNAYLANHKVINEIPADTVFQTGADAPYYRIDPDGNVYMQVLVADSKENRPTDGQRVYFRFMRENLNTWYAGDTVIAEGNTDDILESTPTYFLYNNYTLSSSSQYGYGLQMPLKFVGVNSKVNLIIKSQYGLTDEISNVVPYRYTVNYYKSQI